MKSSEKLREQAALWSGRADLAIEEAKRIGEERAVKFRRKAELLLLDAAKAEQLEQEQVTKHLAAAENEVVAAAKRALNSFNSGLLRQCMREVRNRQMFFVREQQVEKACDLDPLWDQLRQRAEMLERAALTKQMRREAYLIGGSVDEEELAKRIDEAWIELRRTL